MRPHLPSLLLSSVVLAACAAPLPAAPENPVVTVEPPGDEEPIAPPAPPPGPAPPTPVPVPKGPTEEDLVEARGAFREGLEAYEGGDFARAQERFERAYDLSQKAVLLFNLVRAAERAGDREAACRFYRELEARAQEEPPLQRMLDQLTAPC